MIASGLAPAFDVLRKWRAFVRDRGGNVAITFAFATLPVIGAVGAAVDYSHANSVKTAMQSALDAASLMLSRDAATLTNDQLQTKADAYFKALFTRPEAKDVHVNVSYTSTDGSQVYITATAQVPTNLMGVVGYDYMPVTSSATARWGSRMRGAMS